MNTLILIILFLSSVILIMCYKHMFWKNGNDFLATEIKKCNGWHCTHFGLYFIFGLLYPHKYKLAFGLSVVWEFLEWISQFGVQEKYWYADIWDIFYNMTGYTFASTLRLHSKYKL